jgi:putative oxidoreductase
MIEDLVHTDAEPIWALARVVAGAVILPYGMQKLFGWFAGPGLRPSLEQLAGRGIPRPIAWLIVIGQSLGSIALIAGFLGRVAAGGLFIIFCGALIVHAPDGWTMNWFGRKKGEGVEYFVLLLSLLLIVIVKGSGPLSVDSWLMSTRW